MEDHGWEDDRGLFEGEGWWHVDSGADAGVLGSEKDPALVMKLGRKVTLGTAGVKEAEKVVMLTPLGVKVGILSVGAPRVCPAFWFCTTKSRPAASAAAFHWPRNRETAANPMGPITSAKVKRSQTLRFSLH